MQDATPNPPCPRCHGVHVVRNGRLRSGSPQFLCRGCGRRFVPAPRRVPVPADRRELVRRLLRERMSLQGIARATGLSRSWLQTFVNALYREGTPRDPGPLKIKRGGVVIEADELWSFVGPKRDVWWVWVALDARTRQVVAMVAGDRSDETARCLWIALPDAYRDRAVVCTDFLAQYRAVVPEDRHAAAGKEAGLTNHVERFWLTVRQRVGRLVRKTLSFSKCDRNHVGALWDFVRHYNASLL